MATFKSHRMSTCDSHNLTQQTFFCDDATDKLDLASEHVKTLHGESADVYKVRLCYRQLVVSIPRLSAPFYWAKKSVISIMISHFDNKHRCLVERNVLITFILPSRWQYGVESLGIERTSCLCLYR